MFEFAQYIIYMCVFSYVIAFVSYMYETYICMFKNCGKFYKNISKKFYYYIKTWSAFFYYIYLYLLN